MIRDNSEIKHIILYTLNKKVKTEYYIKELSSSIYLDILTTDINLQPNLIKISYQILDNNTKFIYLLEVSDK